VSRPLRDAITDVPGIRVGHWTDRRAATGCTAVLCEKGAVGGVDVRGGAPGTRETDLLRPGTLVQGMHAVVLTGGSAWGLDAAGGVMRYLEERGVGWSFGAGPVPVVVGAVLYDLRLGRSDVRPDAEAGYRACRAARAGAVAQGSVGAGTGATVAKAIGMERCLKGGLGTASEALPSGDGGLIVGALVAVNCFGEVADPASGQVIAGPRALPGKGSFVSTIDVLRGGEQAPWGAESTTLAVVATNARLTKEYACRLASIAHDGLARTIRPLHTLGDGDIVFTMATGQAAVEPMRYVALEALAARAVERAVLKAVREARGLAGVPSAGEWTAG
jgi:L-aminopeptidase/D-esterase-like protein